MSRWSHCCIVEAQSERHNTSLPFNAKTKQWARGCLSDRTLSSRDSLFGQIRKTILSEKLKQMLIVLHFLIALCHVASQWQLDPSSFGGVHLVWQTAAIVRHHSNCRIKSKECSHQPVRPNRGPNEVPADGHRSKSLTRMTLSPPQLCPTAHRTSIFSNWLFPLLGSTPTTPTPQKPEPQPGALWGLFINPTMYYEL